MQIATENPWWSQNLVVLGARATIIWYVSANRYRLRMYNTTLLPQCQRPACPGRKYIGRACSCLPGQATASHQVVLARRCRAPFREAPSERLRVRVRVSVPLMLSPLLLIDAVCRICGTHHQTVSNRKLHRCFKHGTEAGTTAGTSSQYMPVKAGLRAAPLQVHSHCVCIARHLMLPEWNGNQTSGKTVCKCQLHDGVGAISRQSIPHTYLNLRA